MPLYEWMERISHREYLTRLAWLDEQWDKPDRTDHYLMQLCMVVRQILSKNPKAIKLEHHELKFTRKVRKVLTKEQQAAASTSFWFGLVGMPPPEDVFAVQPEYPPDPLVDE